ncbi:MAG: hypothetical protein JSV49_03410 [Thermoplasmata archaeon]|nr:MAG: hypothetical protein JSV49_03410 [Thermoplasmata archaeon]
MIRLTDKQKLVFYSLIRWPALNDVEISEKIDVDRRTVTSIRKNLKTKGMYDTLLIPDFEVLGQELITITYGSFKPFPKGPIKTKSLQDRVNDYPELIYSFISQTDFLNMYLSERYTDFKVVQDQLSKLYNKYVNIEEVKVVHFPLELSKLIFMFDFAPSLKHTFDLEIEEEAEESHEEKKDKELKKLSEKEKLVFYALMRMPEAVDGKIAEMTGISRPTVNSIKERLHHEGIIKELKIPNMMELGFELIVLSHNTLDLEFMEKVYVSERIMQKHTLPTQPYFLITNSMEPESVLFLIFENFTKYKECQDQIATFAKGLKFAPEQVNELLFPVEKLALIKNLNFAPVVKKTFELDVNF